MDKIDYTPSQTQALEISGRNVLVSAAAGSGKTFTLTQRIIKNILEKNADISKILIVTFTRSAAGKLKSDISSAIMDEIAKNPENTHLQKQMLLLGEAEICTIDSFLSRPVRENLEKLRLPMSMRIADDAEIASLSHAVLDDIMASMYKKYNVCDDCNLADINLNTPLTDLLSLLTTTVKDSSEIAPFLIALHGKLITSPRGVELLADFAKRLREDADRDFLDTAEGKRICRELDKITDGGISFYERSYDFVANDELLVTQYLPAFEGDKSELISISESKKQGYEALRSKINAYPSQKIGQVKSPQKTPESIRLHESRNEIISQIQAFRKEYLCYDKDEIRAMYLKTAEMTEVLYTLLHDFDVKYMQEKKNLGIYEFSDMPRYMIELLQNEDGSPSEMAKRISERYKEIYIDEYQDVNKIQDRIFELISNNNRFMVGDIKQSIYVFRDADPSLFADYRRNYPLYSPQTEGDKPPVGSTILMSNNFRSDKNVIEFSNTVCAPMFEACGESISYTSDDDLVLSKKRPENYVPPKVEVHIFAKGSPSDAQKSIPWANIDDTSTPESVARDDGFDEEAVFVANQIAELIRHGKKARKKSTDPDKPLQYDPILPGDIAILVRKKDSIASITKALRALNIEYLLASKSELLQSRDMTLLTELVNVIDNPRNDVPLCSVLTCELLPSSMSFSMGELMSIRAHSGKNISLYDSILTYGGDGEGDPLDTLLSQKCRRLAEKLTSLRLLSSRISAEKFLRTLTADEIFMGFTEGDAFTFMYDSACKYTKSYWNGLSGFVRYFTNIIENGSLSGEVQRIDNAVNIVTMHASKGLQYNTCFLYDCGLQFNRKDYEKSLIYDKDLCVGMHIPARSKGEINTKKLKSIIHKATALDVEGRTLEEEMRILYVALTRAEERLIVSGTIAGNSTYKSFFRKYNLYGISSASTTSQPSLLGWIAGAMHIDGHNKSTYNVTLHSLLNRTPLCKPFEGNDAKTQSQDVDKKTKNYASLMASPPSLRPEEAILSSIPSKVAASKVSEKMLDESIFPDLQLGVLFSAPDENGQIKENEKADSANAIKNRIELMRSQSPDFDSLSGIKQEITAADRGTAMHAFLQYCDYKNILANGIENEISRLIENKFISQHTANILNLSQLKKFSKSNFFSLISSARNIRREFKFGMFRSASEFTQNKELSALVADKKIFVQGSIDLLFEDNDGRIYLCDYKTDGISPEERKDPALLQARMTKAHKHQLDQYSYAIERIFGKKPERTYILSLSLGDAVEIK